MRWTTSSPTAEPTPTTVVDVCPTCDLTDAVACPSCNATGLLRVRPHPPAMPARLPAIPASADAA
jgi:hypothetical protein